MRHTNINTITHGWIKENVTSQSIVVDATIGNGHDTLFLSELVHRVYGFDISDQAMSETKKRVKHKNNVVLFLDSHHQLLKYIKSSIDGIVFNCGYLPNSDHASVTTSETTLAALENAKTLLNPTGWICITVYQGHDHGELEAKKVLDWLESNTIIEYRYTYDGVNKAPIAYFARLKSST